ncbi:YHS domain-containing (seleno)protein [Tepidamorphus sp. 3E244]|uniref:YHS domain-containing (seleno)protein n=1 Tax=Tepidamorphus sp. 3E244 TaxID=3385498 RepID=UPI0038FCD232
MATLVALFALPVAIMFGGGAKAAGQVPGQPVPQNALPVSVDATTGFAIAGFDPVSYFTDGRPRAGDPLNLARWHDAAWIFANPGNQQAFDAHPELYAPRFGGFSVVSLARGHYASGNPELYVMHKGGVLLFHTPQQIAVFNEAPDEFVAMAEAEWRRMNGLPEPKPEKKVEPTSPDAPAPDIFN